MQIKSFAIVLIGFISLFACSENQTPAKKEAQKEYKREKFNPAANPFDDLQKAIAIAQKTGKRIILDVGGEWCVWCHRIDKFLHSDKEINDFLDKHFIIVKVNYSSENKNEKFLSQYPEIKGYPHFFVLESDGTFLHSQDTGLLEEGKSYSKTKVLKFLRKWAK